MVAWFRLLQSELRCTMLLHRVENETALDHKGRLPRTGGGGFVAAGLIRP